MSSASSGGEAFADSVLLYKGDVSIDRDKNKIRVLRPQIKIKIQCERRREESVPCVAIFVKPKL